MKQGFFSALLLLFCFGNISAANVSISGTVIKSGGGALKDVTLSLTETAALTAKTDADGKFTLLSPIKVSEIHTSKSSKPDFTLRGKDLLFSVISEKVSGNVTIYSSNGRQLASIDFNDLVPSSQKLTLPSLSPGLNILRIIMNNSVHTVSILQDGNSLFFKDADQAENRQFKLAEATADAVDTLVAKKTGFLDKKTPLSSYTVTNITISLDSVASKTCNATTLKDAANCSHPILIGTAISQSRFNSSVINEFNYVTPENEMKWQNVEATEGVFNFAQGDAIVNWAQPKGIKVKGHCLVWHSQLAGWVNQAKGKDRVLAVMKRHIETVMGHFGNKVYAWDVVNEAIATDNDNGTGNAKLRPSVFYTEIGADYIEQAFKIAREYADSHSMKDMKLYYNDYSIDADNDKSKFAHTLIKGWVDKGVPVDGIGFQMHIGPPNNIPTAENVRDNMKFYTDLGLEVLISEWDINLCGSKVTAQQQLQLYHDITNYCVNQPKCVAITFWGINDSESWLNSFSGSLCNGGNSQSLLFNNSQKKATYTQVLNALNGK
jgi:endo-1,4-beta-xylanase